MIEGGEVKGGFEDFLSSLQEKLDSSRKQAREDSAKADQYNNNWTKECQRQEFLMYQFNMTLRPILKKKSLKVYQDIMKEYARLFVETKLED